MPITIHSYNYKHSFEYLSTSLEKELVSPPPYFGCEIEVDKGGENAGYAETCIRIMDPIPIIAKHDGSLTDGIEFNTPPMTLEYYKENFSRFKEMFSFLKSKGYLAHDTNTCGLHIHVNREAFGFTRQEQNENIAKICYLFSTFHTLIEDFARRQSNRYATIKYEASFQPWETHDLYNFYASYKTLGKYAAINIGNQNTVEFRIFRGTLNINTFYLCLTFVDTLISIANNYSPECIFILSREDFLGLFPREIQEYIKHRKEKRLEKERQELRQRVEADITPTSTRLTYPSTPPSISTGIYSDYISARNIDFGFVNNRTVGHSTISVDALSADTSSDDQSAVTNIGAEIDNVEPIGISNVRRVGDFTFFRNADGGTRLTYDPESSPNTRGHRAEIASSQSTDGSNSLMSRLRDLLYPSSTESVLPELQSGEVTSLSEMKRKLKTLKKRIKHASSYLEKQPLQREYEILQREYSIERRRLRIAS